MVGTTASVTVLLACAAVAPPLTGLAPQAHADSYEWFQSPSGNVYCGLGMSDTALAVAVCEIRDHTWVAPPPPTPCEGVWRDRVTMSQGSAPEMRCYTDTVGGSGHPVLGYGQSRSLNSIVCLSELSSMTCIDTGTGHYFRLARDNFELL